MSQNALGQLKHLKTARARWPFPDVDAIGRAREELATVYMKVATSKLTSSVSGKKGSDN